MPSLLQALGNVADVPGSMVRDVLSLNNPLDQALPWNWFSQDGRASGADVLDAWGAGPGHTALGTGLELATDPLTYLGAGPAIRGLKALNAASKASHGMGMLNLGKTLAGTAIAGGKAKASKAAAALANALSTKATMQAAARALPGQAWNAAKALPGQTWDAAHYAMRPAVAALMDTPAGSRSTALGAALMGMPALGRGSRGMDMYEEMPDMGPTSPSMSPQEQAAMMLELPEGVNSFSVRGRGLRGRIPLPMGASGYSLTAGLPQM